MKKQSLQKLKSYKISFTLVLDLFNLPLHTRKVHSNKSY